MSSYLDEEPIELDELDEPEYYDIDEDDLDYMATVADDRNEDYYRELAGFGPL